MRTSGKPRRPRIQNPNHALRATVTDDFGIERSLKRCKTCFLWLDAIEDFYQSPLYAKCKKCVGKKQKKHRDKPEVKARRIQYQRNNYQKLVSDPYVKKVLRKREAAWRNSVKDSPEYKAKRAAYDKARLERIYADPEKHAEYLANKRIEGRIRREKMGMPSVPARGVHKLKFPERDYQIRLDVVPIREWLNEQLQHTGLMEFASFCGLDDKVLRRVKTEGTEVELSTVERMLAKTNTLIEDLYPDIDKQHFSRKDEAA